MFIVQKPYSIFFVNARRPRLDHRHTVQRDLQPGPAAWAALQGKTFGHLTAIGYTGQRSQHKHKLMTCLCACGTYTAAPVHNLLHGTTISCGCVRNSRMAVENQRRSTHGHARGGRVSAEYSAWQSMKNRCLKPYDARYPDYGGRGITVCDRWRDSFETFFSDVGPRPSRLYSLGRINNEKSYEPGNVRWETAIEQARNQRNSRRHVLNGVEKTLGAWAAEHATSYELVIQRIDKFGWSLERALTTPAGGGGRHSDEPRDLRGRWGAMIDRCHNQRSRRYRDYGGRGIHVCAAWRASFAAFVQDVGAPPSAQHTLDRINNDAGYEPGNVRWALASTQNRNRRNTRRYELAGESLTLAEWAERANMPYARVKQRVLSYEWSLDEALGTPVGGSGRMAQADRRKWTERSR